MRIVVVEDDPTSGHALRAILTRRGWTVTLAPTLQAGLAAVDVGADCLVLDLMLPDGSGETILEHVRKTGAPMRVVVTTAVTDTVRLNQLAALKPDMVVRKPIDLSQLLRGLNLLS